MDLQNYLGEDDWKTFCSYRREDVFENQNYVSDGLDNATLIKNAMQFLDVAKNNLLRQEHRKSLLQFHYKIYFYMMYLNHL
ncbi:hypothetical protein SD457_06060 [Coprobacillaceae bacterium CR2/5/TPMF4]|nr:hypothetical protein SD457_06060 [Coprobacillaceae bacterium CR2/5/TPMF4]